MLFRSPSIQNTLSELMAQLKGPPSTAIRRASNEIPSWRVRNGAGNRRHVDTVCHLSYCQPLRGMPVFVKPLPSARSTSSFTHSACPLSSSCHVGESVMVLMCFLFFSLFLLGFLAVLLGSSFAEPRGCALWAMIFFFSPPDIISLTFNPFGSNQHL
ncbi:unnamed protein product [Tuber aestivum]|uniref:Uncharacterized protein n=1 Tax=Tuber aestivum TaxID=59557 RepID=A0A292Q247_9PEZI|nr:unnamed protein product [Tuber aestivum]